MRDEISKTNASDKKMRILKNGRILLKEISVFLSMVSSCFNFSYIEAYFNLK